QRAAEQLRLAVAERPDDAQARNVLGTILLRLDALPGATAAFREATALAPTLVEAHVNLAQALDKGGSKDEARAVLDQVSRLKESEAARGRATVLLGLASQQRAAGQPDKALASLKE